MLEAGFKSLLQPKYNDYVIYFHNLGNFDGHFIIQALLNIGKVNIIENKGKIISISLTGKDNNGESIKLVFRDSAQLLLSSLAKLTLGFETPVQKGNFDHLKVNYSNLDQIREEAISYCSADCVSLFQVLTKFNDLIFNIFKVNINKFPTLPGLTFAIFRTGYLKENLIPMITGNNYTRLLASYTGGTTDMFIPTNIVIGRRPKGTNSNLILEAKEKIYAYDFNSLYPFVMANFPLPCGGVKFVQGEGIFKANSDKLGFYNCDVVAPDNLLHPLIQRHVKINQGISTASTLGSFNTTLYSEEIINAIKVGYKFKFINGYVFDKQEILFKEYIKIRVPV
jgi:hypothetical protein